MKHFSLSQRASPSGSAEHTPKAGRLPVVASASAAINDEGDAGSDSRLLNAEGQPPVQGNTADGWQSLLIGRVHWGAALGSMYLSSRALASATAAAGITFPSPLIGMFAILAVLASLTAVSEPTAERVAAAFDPALSWVQKWMPLFYVPSLVVLPLVLRGISGADLSKMLGIIAVGTVATLAATAQVAIVIRNIVKTEMQEAPVAKASPPFTKLHYWAWGAIGAAGLVTAAALPQYTQTATLAVLLAGTVGGYLIGTALPRGVQQVMHPLITCALVANLAAAALGAITGQGYEAALRAYLTKGFGGMGAGDYLMSFLPVVIFSFGFRIFGQRRLMVRHAPEIFGSTFASSAFSLGSTALACKALGLAPELARGLIPRSVTVALALPIAAQLQGNPSITAFAVVLTGLVGANFCQILLNKFGYKDAIVRGLATAGSAHGLGTAALARSEPEALPFCALAYAFIGIISTLLIALPPVRAGLLALTG
ncbi:hypothetical protein WJX72_000351 [[Myrmecia] bisecta]|uniref:Uncharacterized protein n=1 Tax=[Myrmecia] bisecta TaxID=41462 RepID=A0AAW1QNN9_9CHLO